MNLNHDDVVVIKNEVITSETSTCKNDPKLLLQDFYFAEYYKYDETKAVVTSYKGDAYVGPLVG